MNQIATKTRCPGCREIVPATLFERDRDVFLAAECSAHSAWEKLFFKDADLFEKLRRFHPTSPSVPNDGFNRNWAGFAPMVTTCTIDVTTRCNLNCPNCFSDAGSGSKPAGEPSVQEILGLLPPRPARGFVPNISLVGGESILRNDIEQIIAGITALGYTPRLNSNGKGLVDRGLITRLAAAGLKWVILQFDGFSSEVSKRFRGEDLVEHKLKVIALLAEFGINVHFAVMLETGVNDRELGEILRYAVRTPNVRRVSFYPRSNVGRNPAGRSDAGMHMSDVIRGLAESSNGTIIREDLLEFKTIWSRLFALTGNPVFRNRACLAPFIIQRDGENLIPLNRIIRPGADLKRWKRLAGLIVELPRLWRFDRGDYSTDILPVNIEKFYDTAAFDQEASSNCHQAYLTKDGYIPFCLYNSFFRDRSPAGC